MYVYTVEPPNKGHFGTCHFVHYSEVVLFLNVLLPWKMIALEYHQLSFVERFFSPRREGILSLS